AHNAAFDTGFIWENEKRLGIDAEHTAIDTVSMARTYLPDLKNYKLETICGYFNIDPGHHHRAVDDAEATAQVFQKLLNMARNDGVTNLEELSGRSKMSSNAVKRTKPYHCTILAANDTGRVNLYRLISASHIDYFSRIPRIPKTLLRSLREGLIVGSACEAGEVFQAVLDDASDEELRRIAEFYDYLEIMPVGNNAFMVDSDRFPDITSLDDIREINKKIAALGEALEKPVCATGDVHYIDREDEIYRRILKHSKGMDDEEAEPSLYFRTTEEMLEEFSYLGSEKAFEVVVTNTNLIAGRIEKISPLSPEKCPPVIENSDGLLKEICYQKAHELYGDVLPEIVEKRLEKELNPIITNGFAVMYMIARKLVMKSLSDGYLVGSRGSVGSSLVAYLSGITEVNSLQAHYRCPKCRWSDFDSDYVKSFAGRSGYDMEDRNCPVCGEKLVKDGHDIPFETFLGFEGEKDPDIDLNFSGEYQPKAHSYTEVIFGHKQTFRAGTIGDVAEKTAFGLVKGYLESKGITKRNCEIARLAKGCVGVKRTTGQHPGGIVVLPWGKDINTFTPVQHPANDQKTKIVTTHFDYHSIDHNLLKLDILGHDDPTLIRMLQNLTGVDPRKIPLDDKKVLSLFRSTEALGITPEDIGGTELGSLGIPEFGTKFVIQMLLDTKPDAFSSLVRISGLSHGTDVWSNYAQDLVRAGTAGIDTCICTRDDIMIYLIGMGMEPSEAFLIMESVRKGKGLNAGWEQSMRELNVPDWYINSCNKIKYMFPKAHAVAYVMMSLRIAWFKVYEPLAYYAAYFSIRADTFSYEKMCRGHDLLERSMREVETGIASTKKDEEQYKIMKIVQEFLARGFEFLPIDLYKSDASRFIIEDGKLRPPFSSLEGMGDTAAASLYNAAREGEFLSKDEIRQRGKVSVTMVEKMSDLGIIKAIPESSQISLFDLGL
ncbi:MAG: PolC-type DNA polymerase III, partial [Lachnospiraceae bacterium]|nr:PolC-type DNA polymerase III [Lachnospiraceae bacterium]